MMKGALMPSSSAAPHPNLRPGMTPPRRTNRPPGPLVRLRGKALEVLFLGGTVVRGRLVEVSRFEIVLETQRGTLTAMKHAVLGLREAKGALEVEAAPAPCHVGSERQGTGSVTLGRSAGTPAGGVA